MAQLAKPYLLMLLMVPQFVCAQKEARQLLMGKFPTTLHFSDSMTHGFNQNWNPPLHQDYFGTIIRDAIWQDCENDRVFYSFRNSVYSFSLTTSGQPMLATIDSARSDLIAFSKPYLLPYPGDRTKLLLVALNNDFDPYGTSWPQSLHVSTFSTQLGSQGLLSSVDLDTSIFAGLSIARHANKRDFWIILGYKSGINRLTLKSYLVDPIGVRRTPSHTYSFYNQHQYNNFSIDVEVSAQSDRVVVHAYEPFINVIKFNNELGEFHGNIPVNIFQIMTGPAGLAMVSNGAISPNGQRYYTFFLDARRTVPRFRQMQFDLYRVDSVDMVRGLNSFLIDEMIEEFYTGRDNRVYFTTPFSDYGKYNFPDERGSFADRVYPYMNMRRPGGLGGYLRFSSHVPAWNDPKRFGIDGPERVCKGMEQRYTIREPYRLDSVSWEHYSPTANLLQTSSGSFVDLQFLERGTHQLRGTSHYCDSVMTLALAIEVTDIPEDWLEDTAFCQDNQLTIYAPHDSSQLIQWSDGSNGNTLQITSSGWYWLERLNACGMRRDSFYVAPFKLPKTGLPRDTVICKDDILLMSAIPGAYDIIWPDGRSGYQYEISSSGIYQYGIENECGFFLDTIQVFSLHEPGSGSMDSITCRLFPTQFPDSAWLYTAALWSDGEDSYPRVFESSFMGSVKLRNVCGEGDYDVNIEEIDCQCKLLVPNVFTPNGDGLNDRFRVFSPCEISDFHLIIMDRWGKVIYESKDINNGWDGRLGEKMMPEGAYAFRIIYNGPYRSSPYIYQDSFILLMN